jgi:hypothetical protein
MPDGTPATDADAPPGSPASDAPPGSPASDVPPGSPASDVPDAGAPALGVAGPADDRAGFKFAAFGALLIVVLFAGYGLGRLNSGTTASEPPAEAGSSAGAAGVVDENQPHVHGSTGGAAAQVSGASAAGVAVGGLSLSSGGLTLVPQRSDFVAGQRQRLAFRIAGAGGAPITTYSVVHDKMLHLIVVRRDLTGFQHLHPTMAADGTWGIDLTLAEPGIYRMIADFTAVVGGTQIATTLGADLTVAGNYAPKALPAPVKTATVDGFTVTYEGATSTRATMPLLIRATGPDGRVATLEPYLGAYGHLVVMRQGDLAYVHVHPEAQVVDGQVKFWVAMPSAGSYRMFFDFQVAGQVRTAEWTAVVS